MNTSKHAICRLLKEVGSTEWVRQGHADYHEKAGGKCPYCSRDLPQNFEEMLAASFDTQYQTNLQKLDASWLLIGICKCPVRPVESAAG